MTIRANTPKSSLFDTQKNAKFDRRVVEVLRKPVKGFRTPGFVQNPYPDPLEPVPVCTGRG